MMTISNYKVYLILGILIAILIPSLVMNALSYGAKNSISTNPNSTKKPSNVNGALFDFQSAIFSGKITKIEGNKIWLENKNGITGDAEVAPNVLINKTFKTGIASPSSDLKQIELNKDVSINFQAVNGEYQAIAISFIPIVQPYNPNSKSSPIPPKSALPQSSPEITPRPMPSFPNP